MSNKIDGYSPSTTLVTGSGRSGAPAPTLNSDAAAAAPPAPSTSDTATVSTAALTLAKLSVAVDQSSGVDSAKVASLQAAISQGTYQVDAQSVAAKLLATQNELK